MIEEHNKSANDVDIKTIAFDWNNKANVEYWGQKFNFKKVELPNDIKFMFQKYIPLMPDQNVFGAQTEMNVTVHLPINIIRWRIKETIALQIMWIIVDIQEVLHTKINI